MKQHTFIYNKPLFLFLGFCLLITTTLRGQGSISIKASATVVEVTGIELVPMKDMIVDEASSKEGILNISPVTDDKAGKILVRGKINAQVRLTYVRDLLLTNSSGDGAMIFKYSLSGLKSDNQGASQLIDQVERIVQFNEKGEFYLWLGGQVDLSKAKPGSYEGEFTIDIEYI